MSRILATLRFTFAATILFKTAALAVLAADEKGESKKTLEQVLLPAIQQHRGEVAVAVKHLKTGESYEYQAGRTMPTASLIKFPVMAAAYHAVEKGKLSLDERIELKADDKVQGSGILTEHFSPGATISLRDAIHLMIVFSDNTATNLVIDKLGLAATNEYTSSLGCPETRINAKVYRAGTSIAPARSKEFGLGSTTARDMVKLCELLHGRKLVSQDASDKMLKHLFACADKQKGRPSSGSWMMGGSA